MGASPKMKNLMKKKRIRERVSWPRRKPEAKPREEEEELVGWAESGWVLAG